MNTLNNPVARVRVALRESELLRAVASIQRDGGLALAFGEIEPRPLISAEISKLETLGNCAEDWARVRVAGSFNPHAIRQSCLLGDVVLGAFTGRARLAPGIELPTGVYRSTLQNCVIGPDCLVRDVRLLANYIVAAGALLLDCGLVACEGPTAFGNGTVLPLAVETGGREVVVYAEIDLEVAEAVARSRADRELLEHYGRAVADYAAAAVSPRGLIGSGAMVRDTPQVRNCYVGPHARVDGAALLADSTLLSSAEEPAEVASGACVCSSLLQWGSRAATHALVERCVLTEHSHVERHGKVSDSILGPNTGVAEGEVTASLLGPFVGFHHQALLIAALWPEGKGNVAYGANVGSNHTSRVPDQEFWPGEGLYVGLGVNVKYPANFTEAPYTILATGISTLPQKVAFPFSLINKPWQPCPGLSPAYNEIIPAWVLTDDLYMLRRNEEKYRARNRARRTPFDFSVFRADTVALMSRACVSLESVSLVKDFYTEKDIPGLGKNFLKEEHRHPAIEAYRFFIQIYALLGLKGRVETLLRAGQHQVALDLLSTPSSDETWEQQRQILLDEPGMTSVVEALAHLPGMLKTAASDIERSKEKDDERGRRILDDYSFVHIPAERDAFVQQTWADTHRLVDEMEALLRQLAGAAECAPLT